MHLRHGLKKCVKMLCREGERSAARGEEGRERERKRKRMREREREGEGEKEKEREREGQGGRELGTYGIMLHNAREYTHTLSSRSRRGTIPTGFC